MPLEPISKTPELAITSLPATLLLALLSVMSRRSLAGASSWLRSGIFEMGSREHGDCMLLDGFELHDSIGTIDLIGDEVDPIASLDQIQHRRILDLKNHRHGRHV